MSIFLSLWSWLCTSVVAFDTCCWCLHTFNSQMSHLAVWARLICELLTLSQSFPSYLCLLHMLCPSAIHCHFFYLDFFNIYFYNVCQEWRRLTQKCIAWQPTVSCVFCESRVCHHRLWGVCFASCADCRVTSSAGYEHICAYHFYAVGCKNFSGHL